MASVSAKGMTSPAALPLAGQIAPKRYAHIVRWSFAAFGRVPRRAQRRVIGSFRPMRSSSRHHSSSSVPQWRGRAESFRKPRARSSRPSV